MTDESAAGEQLRLGDAAIAAFDVDGAVAHFSAAIRGFTAEANPCQAAMACVRLGEIYANFLGNLAAGRAWFARGARLVESEPPCVEQGWVAIAAMGCDVDDPADLLARSELALDRARTFGDVNLETKALADAGLAHVQAGRVAEGMALLDEAMALACGPADDLDTAGKSVCSFFTACYFAADFERAGSWAEMLRQRGLIGAAPFVPIVLSNHCDSVQAALLCELGRWQEAEAVLTRAIEDFERCIPGPSWHPAIALADLRVRQGRLADAEQLLLGKDAHLQALLPAARLHLARRDYDLARATALRGLRAIGDDRLRAVELLAVVVDAELARGNLEAAHAACEELVARTGALGLTAIQAKTAAARGRVMAAAGDRAGAIARIQHGLDQLSASNAPWLRVTLLLDLARLYEQAGDRAAATVEAKAATATLAGLDVVLPASDLELLARLGLTASIPGRAAVSPTATLTRDGRGWVAVCRHDRVRLADSKGLRYLAELVARPGVEQHVLDLVDRVEGVTHDGGLERRLLGDAGELSDSRARAMYRRRIEELRAEIDDALRTEDLDKTELLQAELDQLVAHLGQAFGLGGRSRPAASAAERARLNVTRAIRAAIARLTVDLPEAGAELDRRTRTGLYCRYEPGETEGVRWIVQS